MILYNNTDSDHVGDPDMTSCSHTGVMILMNTVPIKWRSTKQPKTVLSPAHAEIFACSEGLKEANWVRWTAQDMQTPVPPVAVMRHVLSQNYKGPSVTDGNG